MLWRKLAGRLSVRLTSYETTIPCGSTRKEPHRWGQKQGQPQLRKCTRNANVAHTSPNRFAHVDNRSQMIHSKWSCERVEVDGTSTESPWRGQCGLPPSRLLAARGLFYNDNRFLTRRIPGANMAKVTSIVFLPPTTRRPNHELRVERYLTMATPHDETSLVRGFLLPIFDDRTLQSLSPTTTKCLGFLRSSMAWSDSLTGATSL